MTMLPCFAKGSKIWTPNIGIGHYRLLAALIGGIVAAGEEVVSRVALPVQALVPVRRNAHGLQYLNV